MRKNHPGFGKYLLSFIQDVKIETASSQFNPWLEVVFSEGKFLLSSKTATYSYEDKYESYKGAFNYVRNEIKNMQSALVLGLGLGSIPYLLQSKYGFQSRIDCVEIDEVIIRLARKYYPSANGLSKLDIYHADACGWIKQNTKQYDLVAVDLFIDTDVPEKFHSAEFLGSVLKNSGTL